MLGIVGAGQLARMTCEAASALGIRTVVLAARADDAAAETASEVLVGEATDEEALRALAGRCDVVTFDHEQVDLGALRALERAGIVLRPGAETLEVACDKAEMRRRLSAAGIAVPRFEVLGDSDGAEGVPGVPGAPARPATKVVSFAAHAGWPLVVKAARGGYDGKGVWPVADEAEARAVCEAVGEGTPLLVESYVDMDVELAVVVARGPDGGSVAWPPVETAQVEGVCREIRYPGSLDAGLAADAAALGQKVAAVVGATGVLAVEMFATGGRLLVNEIAARPHNSAHWTIEGSTTSQFENHVRAVLGLPLGDPRPAVPHVATVNVFGATGPDAGETGDPGARLSGALDVPGAHVHLYGKAPRPGRKLGHVTVCGDDPDDVRARAWAAARALGTPVPASIVGVSVDSGANVPGAS